MTDAQKASLLADLKATSRQYDKTAAAHEAARDAAVEAVLAALRGGVGPTEAARNSPFTDTYVRRLAREAGIPPARAGKKPGKRRTAMRT